MPYEITGMEAKASPEALRQGGKFEVKADVLIGKGNPGDHVLRMEIYDPAGRLSRAYTDNVLAVGGRFTRTIQTALNEQPGRWKVLMIDVISGKNAAATFRIEE